MRTKLHALCIIILLCARMHSVSATEVADPSTISLVQATPIAIQTLQRHAVWVAPTINKTGFAAWRLIQENSLTFTAGPNVVIEVIQDNDALIYVTLSDIGDTWVDTHISGSNETHRLEIIGYELDRSGVVLAEIIQGPAEDPELARMIATLKIIPWIDNLEHTIGFHAHDATFVDGSREFVTVSNSDTTSPIGNFVKVIDENGNEEGVMEFEIRLPITDTTVFHQWCMHFEQHEVNVEENVSILEEILVAYFLGEK